MNTELSIADASLRVVGASTACAIGRARCPSALQDICRHFVSASTVSEPAYHNQRLLSYRATYVVVLHDISSRDIWFDLVHLGNPSFSIAPGSALSLYRYTRLQITVFTTCMQLNGPRMMLLGSKSDGDAGLVCKKVAFPCSIDGTQRIYVLANFATSLLSDLAVVFAGPEQAHGTAAKHRRDGPKRRSYCYRFNVAAVVQAAGSSLAQRPRFSDPRNPKLKRQRPILVSPRHDALNLKSTKLVETPD